MYKQSHGGAILGDSDSERTLPIAARLMIGRQERKVILKKNRLFSTPEQEKFIREELPGLLGIVLEDNSEEQISVFIREVYISNFRCFRAAEKEDLSDAFCIPLNTPTDNQPGSGLTVLLGENNSGKSTVLRAIHLFSSNMGDKPSEPIADFIEDGGLIHNTGAQEKLMTILLTTINDEKLIIKAIKKDDAVFCGKNKKNISCMIDEIVDPQQSITDTLSELLQQLDRKAIKICEEFCDRCSTEKDKDNLVEAFKDLLYFTDVLKDISANISTESLRGITWGNFVEKAFHINVGEEPRFLETNAFFFEKKPNGKRINARNLGLGVLQAGNVFGRIGTAQEDGGCRLFLLDEPEQNLHPKAVEAVIEELWKIAKDTQIILTSHSPVLVEAVCRQAQAAGKKPEDYFRILSKDAETDNVRSQSAKPFLLNPVSADEINYCAFDYPTASYYIHLYGALKERLQVRQKSDGIPEDAIVRKDLKEITEKRKTLGKCVPWKDKYPGEKEEEDTAIFIRHFCNTLKHSQFKKIKYSPNDLLPELIEALRALIEYNNDIGNNRHLSKHPS